jgi:hypothetical protein
MDRRVTDTKAQSSESDNKHEYKEAGVRNTCGNYSNQFKCGGPRECLAKVGPKVFSLSYQDSDHILSRNETIQSETDL